MYIRIHLELFGNICLKKLTSREVVGKFREILTGDVRKLTGDIEKLTGDVGKLM